MEGHKLLLSLIPTLAGTGAAIAVKSDVVLSCAKYGDKFPRRRPAFMSNDYLEGDILIHNNNVGEKQQLQQISTLHRVMAEIVREDEIV
ncbi:hypothetical protein BJY04DRAFT_184227 [Aspergillus karnatakaensis]|uniref:uncharacterized protein n=1 Tax=Aspergillus karnatakaensis TaxID=1810916 RepID=UPI003CCD00DB